MDKYFLTKNFSMDTHLYTFKTHVLLYKFKELSTASKYNNFYQ